MASRTDSLEQEVKLDVDLGFQVPDLTGVVEGAITDRRPTIQLVATYFDTPDLRLLQRGITLRRRRDSKAGGEDLWTLKVPQGNGTSTLDRTEISWPGQESGIPDEATGLVRGIVRHATLGAVAELETMRQRLVLRDAVGATLGELDDDTVAVHGGSQDGLRFRQVEFELADGEASVVDALVGRLGEAGASIDRRGPKLAQALGVEPGSLSGGRAPELGPDSVLGDVVRASISSALERMLDHEYGIRLATGDDAEAVHQTRVATRRLRSDLKTFAAVLDPVWLSHTRADLKWIADSLGTVRDIDVLAGHLESEMGHAPTPDAQPFGEINLELRRRRQVAHAHLLEDMSGERYLTLLDRLHASSESPPFLVTAASSKSHAGLRPDDPARRVLPTLVRRPWRKLRKAVRHVGSHPTDQELHQIRIRAKRLRYAAEAAAPVVGKPARRMAVAVESLQTVLGDHHDAVTAEDWFRREAATGSRAVAFSAGQLVAVQRHRQTRLRRQWRGVWSSLDRKKLRRWLR
ncbi:MAG TPA: CYTH and CHAD domain-containing protein [Acidimicrobiales bacterium]|nr:CYTH and CHAD domain-containing protein [Acidimicrobiales bacterium]